MNQLTIDFKPRQNTYEKKLERLSFACSEDFKHFLDLLAGRLNVDRSTLIHRFVLEGMQRTLADMFLAEPHLDQSLREILRNNG